MTPFKALLFVAVLAPLSAAYASGGNTPQAYAEAAAKAHQCVEAATTKELQKGVFNPNSSFVSPAYQACADIITNSLPKADGDESHVNVDGIVRKTACVTAAKFNHNERIKLSPEVVALRDKATNPDNRGLYDKIFAATSPMDTCLKKQAATGPVKDFQTASAACTKEIQEGFAQFGKIEEVKALPAGQAEMYYRSIGLRGFENANCLSRGTP